VSNGFSDDIDPEIAALLGDAARSTAPSNNLPKFEALFADDAKDKKSDKASNESRNAPKPVDYNQKTFPKVEKFQQEPPNTFFADKDYYKKILDGEGEVGLRVHSLLTDFFKVTDAEQRTTIRMRLINAYWELIGSLALKLGPKMPLPKRVVIRFGALLPSLITADQRKNIASIFWNNQFEEPIYFMDEWLEMVATQVMNPLATDEPISKKDRSGGNENAIYVQKLERAESQKQAQIALIQSKLNEMSIHENSIIENANSLKRKTPHRYAKEISMGYEHQHHHALNQIAESVRSLNILDREVSRFLNELDKMEQEVRTFKSKVEATAGGDAAVDTKLVASEVISMRQVAKMTCGRQGNQFPILMKNYMPHMFRDYGTRENVLKILADVEYLDPGIFVRRYKQSEHRIVPCVILVPTYGEFGVCWEPFEKLKGRSSRGRIAVPMFGKNLRLAVLYGLADYRWQLAKELAGFHWMEEGITGLYYAWFAQNKLKGDVKQYFIRDYINWITKESEGTQRLNKEIRGIFWRNIPFPLEVREKLRNMGAIYNDLYLKDQNRALSIGY